MKGELERILYKAVLNYYELLYRNYLGETVRSHKKYPSIHPAFVPSIKIRTLA